MFICLFIIVLIFFAAIMKIRSHKELEVYILAFDTAMRIFEISKRFPKEETYSLTDQIRRSSRSVCANVAEAFRKRKYPKSFVAKITDSEGEAAETQNWLEFSRACQYISPEEFSELDKKYENIIGKLVNMSARPENWSW
jgi:four helix bundle protein